MSDLPDENFPTREINGSRLDRLTNYVATKVRIGPEGLSSTGDMVSMVILTLVIGSEIA
jgi:hypothetical protein